MRRDQRVKLSICAVCIFVQVFLGFVERHSGPLLLELLSRRKLEIRKALSGTLPLKR